MYKYIFFTHYIILINTMVEKPQKNKPIVEDTNTKINHLITRIVVRTSLL